MYFLQADSQYLVHTSTFIFVCCGPMSSVFATFGASQSVVSYEQQLHCLDHGMSPVIPISRALTMVCQGVLMQIAAVSGSSLEITEVMRIKNLTTKSTSTIYIACNNLLSTTRCFDGLTKCCHNCSFGGSMY